MCVCVCVYLCVSGCLCYKCVSVYAVKLIFMCMYHLLCFLYVVYGLHMQVG